MRTKVISAACLALAGPALASAMAGCGQHAPAASRSSASRSSAASTRLAAQASRSRAPGRISASRSGQAPSRQATTSRDQGGSQLADGLYADAPSNTAHYVFALAHSGPGTVHGSVTFFYQDGRADTVGKYTGKLSGDGRLSLVFSNGRRLTGTYRSGQLTLANCASVLTWASHSGYCQFAHGDTP